MTKANALSRCVTYSSLCVGRVKFLDRPFYHLVARSQEAANGDVGHQDADSGQTWAVDANQTAATGPELQMKGRDDLRS